MKFKGPVFPSYRDANPSIRSMGQSAVKPRLVWKPNTQSVRERVRNMRRIAKHILDSKDPEIINAGDRVFNLVADEPNPGFSALHLMCAGVTMAKETGNSWPVCMSEIISKFEQRGELAATLDIEDQLSGQLEHASQELHHAETAIRNQGGSLLRRLLRALVPRSIRPRNETAPEIHQHQRPRHVNGQRKAGGEYGPTVRDRQGDGATTKGLA